MRYPARLLLAVSTLMLLALPASALLAASTTVLISPNSGPPGSTATVSGSGFTPGATVRVLWDSLSGPQIGSNTADGSGNLPNTSVTIPAATAGSYNVFASDGTNSASTTFTIPFSLNLNPSSGAPGSSVAVSGSGYAAGEIVSVAWDTLSNQLATATADGHGSFSASLTVPANAAAGNHVVLAAGQNSHFSQATTFTVNASANTGGASISISPPSGPAGSQVAVSGSGFVAGEQVNLTIDGASLTSVTSDSNSAFSLNVTLPSGLSNGAHTIAASGASSNRSASVVFTVTSRARTVSCGDGDNDADDQVRPGFGFGDKNHCHTGPRGPHKVKHHKVKHHHEGASPLIRPQSFLRGDGDHDDDDR